MASNSVGNEVFLKQYLRAILDIRREKSYAVDKTTYYKLQILLGGS